MPFGIRGGVGIHKQTGQLPNRAAGQLIRLVAKNYFRILFTELDAGTAEQHRADWRIRSVYSDSWLSLRMACGALSLPPNLAFCNLTNCEPTNGTRQTKLRGARLQRPKTANQASGSIDWRGL